MYGSSITIADEDPPAQATVTGDFGDGLGHDGTLVGTVDAFDAGSGVRRVEVTFAGMTQTSSPPCDYSMPRPCPARDSFAIQADAGPVEDGPHPLTVTVTDASGRSTTTSSEVVVGRAQLQPLIGTEAVEPGEPVGTGGSSAATPAAFDPFATGHGRDQLASCAGAPSVVASRLHGRRLVVQAIASRRLAGRLAILRSARRRVASAKVAADGRVRLSGRLRSSELSADFSVWVGVHGSAPMRAPPAITLTARRHATTVRLTGANTRHAGRRVELQRLVACGRWRRVGRASTTARRRFAVSVAAGPAAGGAYGALVVTVPRRGALPRRTSSVVAVT